MPPQCFDTTLVKISSQNLENYSFYRKNTENILSSFDMKFSSWHVRYLSGAFSCMSIPLSKIDLAILTFGHSNMISSEAVLKISGQNSNQKASKPLIEKKRGFFFVHPLLW